MIVNNDWLQQLEAHADEGPIGEPAARDLLRMALQMYAALKHIGSGKSQDPQYDAMIGAGVIEAPFTEKYK